MPATGPADEILDFATAVAAGLTDSPRWLPCRFLYDAAGSALFEEITRLPEYYLTRTETSILERAALEIRDRTGPLTLLELGSGSSTKTSLLLSAYETTADTVRYVPVDVSEAAITDARKRLAQRHPDVEVEGFVGRYEESFSLFPRHSPLMVLFLGSTIGNFNQDESLRFWKRIAANLQPGDYFLLGADLVKDRGVLESAYNDSAGITAQFTTNLFGRMNRELDAGVDVSEVEHVARYNDEWQRIEIFARFHTTQAIRIGPLDLQVVVEAGEQVMVEISRKFVVNHLATYLSVFGFEVQRVFTDDRQWFAVLLLRRTEDYPQ
jgi:L-histidine N-alpha-methyltransferase